MKIYRTSCGLIVESSAGYSRLEISWDSLFEEENLAAMLQEVLITADPFDWNDDVEVLAPVDSQEVWAAGVTYFKSRDARMEESSATGGDNFYDRVYEASRPELFFKAAGWRVVGPEKSVRIREDSKWNVPEPELTLAISRDGAIIGYTIGNDMSSRDIEGENPLYLPQAKTYDGSCAIGPCILVNSSPLPSGSVIGLEIERAESLVFEGQTTLAQLKRSPEELVEHLFRETSFPVGCLLMTGTGVVPPSDFTLELQDRMSITIDGIGTLSNTVAG
jgi:2-dehydro-3-deoxy-D-arabinonate dehydratase